MPKKIKFEAEKQMSVIKKKMMESVEEYKEKHCDKNGYPESNFSKQEWAGVKEIKEKTKNKECFVKQTDKSGKLTIDTVENYSSFIEEHTTNDELIDVKKVDYLESKLNDNLKILNRIFNVGGDTNRRNNEDRVNLASVSTHSSIPVLDGVRKDHKSVPPGQETAGSI